MEKHKVLDQLLVELHRLLLILDKETLSGSATVQKGLLADLLQSYRASNGADEEYIYMNKVLVGVKNDKDEKSDRQVNDKAAKHVPVPQKSLPDLPPPRVQTSATGQGAVTREPFPLPAVPFPARTDTSESYYEEAQPYEETANDDGEAVSSSYESYDEDEVTRGKSPSARHQWPSSEASIELMKDARICAFLWRKKWLGQWAKQLCVIKEHRLLCYKSSKEQTPLLDVSLLGCSVIYKEKQVKKKEHKLKIVPVGLEAIVLGLQSKEQAEQWLKVIREISPKPAEVCDLQPTISDSTRLICTKGEQSERYSVASESGSSTDSHAETPEIKDVKKKYGAGSMFSNLRNIGKKKMCSLDIPEKTIDTSGYLNVLVNSQWRTCWCLIKNGQLWFYQDKGRSKLSQPAVTLEGCSVSPDPSPEHLYSFRIDMDGNQLATLEAKTSADMGHWLGLLLSQTGTKTEPEELTYDYVNSERITAIVNAAKTSFYLMQRRFSEPNTYIDTSPSIPINSDELYDDVASLADPEDTGESNPPSHLADGNHQEPGESSCHCIDDQKIELQEDDDRVYIDLVPVRSFLHTPGGSKISNREPVRSSPVTVEEQKDVFCQGKEVLSPSPAEPDEQSSSINGPGLAPAAAAKPELNRAHSAASQQAPSQPAKSSPQSLDNFKRGGLGPQKSFPSPGTQISKISGAQTSPLGHSPPPGRLKPHAVGSATGLEVKLGKNRTEADMRRYTDERDRLEREREEVRSSLAKLKKEKRETKEELGTCQESKQHVLLEARLREREEACREAERRRVEVELRLVEVKENLKKAESGPFTLGTTLDSSLQDSSMPKVATVPGPQTSPSPPSLPPSQPSNGVATDPASPVNNASALKNRPASIVSSKGNVLQKAKEWEKKSSN